MAQRSFKDVGVRADIARQNEVAKSQIPIGIKTPLELSSQDGLFAMHYSVKDQIADNLKNLLLTNHGERLALTDFGADLRPLVFEFSNKDDFDSEAMVRINTSVSKYMPFVTLIGFESFPNYEENEFTGIIRLVITYSVAALNINENFVEVTLFVE